jgi:DNA-binding IclR family transcriptional regulator
MIQLGVLDDELNVVFLARQDCNSGLRLGLRAEIGRRVPANCSGTGKALLAALSEEVLDARLTGLRSLPTLTDRSISDPAELRRQIVSIRQTGYASEREEALSGVACLARAFRTNYRDNGILAMSITAREHMVTTDLSEIMRRTLFDLTYQLETRL